MPPTHRPTEPPVQTIGRLWSLAALPVMGALFVGGAANLIGNAVAFAVSPTDWWSHGLVISLSGVTLVIALRAARRQATRPDGPTWFSRAILILMASGFTFGAWAGGQLLERRRASFERMAHAICAVDDSPASEDCLKAAWPCVRSAWTQQSAFDAIEPAARACMSSTTR